MNNVIRIAAFFLIAMLAPLAGRAETLVIEGGTVHPMSGEPFAGRVVIEDGVIVAAGADVAPPPGATRIDATGLHVYPGVFDALSTLGLVEINSVSASNDQAEMGMYNPHLAAAAAIHPSSEVIPVTRANGITHAIVTPRSERDGVISGQAVLVNLAGWTVEEMTIDASVALVINWPAIVMRSFDSATFTVKDAKYKDAKAEVEKKQRELREWVEAARHYRQAKAAERSRADKDPKLAALAECLDGGKPVIIHANKKRDIEAAIAFAEEFGLRMILAGGAEALKVKDRLAVRSIPVILGRTQSLPGEEDDPYHRTFATPAALRDAGVRIAFASAASGGSGPGGPHSSRTLPYEAAMSVGFGLSEEDAMRALTLWPAEILGVADRLGSIVTGRIANLIVTDGNPLEITSNVRHLIIAGREVPADNMHDNLYGKYRSRPQPRPAGGAATSR